MKAINLYLAGTIYNDEPGKSWKKRLIQELDSSMYKSFDPDPVNECNNTMIARDKYEITNCNIFVAYIERPTFGTSMEILHAFNQQTTPIIVINPGLKYQNDLWLKYHSHLICDNITECADHIKTMRF
jgi:hypothetical protein